MTSVHHSLDLADAPQLVEDPPRVLLVGLGKAGARFLQAMQYVQDQTRAVRLVGVCDTNSQRLDRVDLDGVSCFTDLRVALTDLQPDVVCVCVNEVGHYEVLAAVAECPSVRAVLTEKPLTETLQQAEVIVSAMSDRLVCVNFVERYSPMVDEFLEWSTFNAAQVNRAEFFWGKYRYMDTRPTMGVLSEISHPVDLVRCLLGEDSEAPVDVHSASGTRSRFSVLDTPLIDTVDVLYSVAGTPVRGHSSFLWEGRDRRVVLYGRTGFDNSHFQAVLDFDRPRWDCDALTINRIDAQSGEREVVLATRCQHADFPSQLSHIFKVARFCVTALRALTARNGTDRLAEAQDALWVQRVIETIGQMVGDCRVVEF